MEKDKLTLRDLYIDDVVDLLTDVKVRKDPKHKAKQTQAHRDRTKYKRRPKHVRNTQDGSE